MMEYLIDILLLILGLSVGIAAGIIGTALLVGKANCEL